MVWSYSIVKKILILKAKCANFVLCPRELSKKFLSKVRTSFLDVLSVTCILLSEKTKTKIRHFSSKSPKIGEFPRITLSLLLHNTVIISCVAYRITVFSRLNVRSRINTEFPSLSWNYKHWSALNILFILFTYTSKLNARYYGEIGMAVYDNG